MRLVLLVSEDVKIVCGFKKERKQLQRLYITVSTTFFSIYFIPFQEVTLTPSPILFLGGGGAEGGTLHVLMFRYDVNWGGSWDWEGGGWLGV